MLYCTVLYSSSKSARRGRKPLFLSLLSPINSGSGFSAICRLSHRHDSFFCVLSSRFIHLVRAVLPCALSCCTSTTTSRSSCTGTVVWFFLRWRQVWYSISFVPLLLDITWKLLVAITVLLSSLFNHGSILLREWTGPWHILALIRVICYGVRGDSGSGGKIKPFVGVRMEQVYTTISASRIQKCLSQGSPYLAVCFLLSCRRVCSWRTSRVTETNIAEEIRWCGVGGGSHSNTNASCCCNFCEPCYNFCNTLLMGVDDSDDFHSVSQKAAHRHRRSRASNSGREWYMIWCIDGTFLDSTRPSHRRTP